MSLLGKISGLFGARPTGDQVISLEGKMTRVSGAELGILNKMAETGLVRKSADDAGVSMGSYTQGVPAFWFARAVETSGGSESLTSPYERSVWVQRAIKSISGPVSSVQVTFMNKNRGEAGGLRKGRGRGKRVWNAAGMAKKIGGADGQDEIDLPAVRQWLERPVRGLNYSDFVEASVGWLKMAECFWLISDEMFKPFPDVASTFPPVIVARPQYMRPVIEDNNLMGWVFTQPGGKMYHLLPEQVIQLRYWNPENDWRGLGEYPSAHLAAEADYLAGKFARNLMANNGDLGGIIIAKNGVPSDPQREQIIMDLRSKRQAQLRGDLRYTFLTGDIDIKDPKITSVDAPFIAQRLENRHEIALAFGVPPSLFDVKAAYSIGSASDFFQLIINTCIPTGAKFCDALERLIERMTGEQIEVGLEWDEHPVMQTVRRERIDAVDKLWSKGMPMSSINDYLGLDMEPFEGWDVGYLPTMVTPVGEALEPEPAPAVNPALAELPGTPAPKETEETPADQVPAQVKAMIEAVQTKAKAAKGKKHLLWEHHMRQRSATVKAMQSKVNKVLVEYRARALKRLAQHGAATAKSGEAALREKGFLPIQEQSEAGVTKSLIDFIFDHKTFGSAVMEIIKPVMHGALQTASDELRKSELGLEDPWKFPPRQAMEFIDGRERSVMGCGETVRNQLNTALGEGFAKGETVEELSDRVRGVFNNLGKFESKRIAMTETSMSFNFARDAAMKEAGVEYKAWLSSHGENVRPAHAEAEERYDNEPIPVDEPFEVGGEYLMYPGDPDGSPENVINCHCVSVAVRPTPRK